jgi:hypothetical protein
MGWLQTLIHLSSASWVARITGVTHHAWPMGSFLRNYQTILHNSWTILHSQKQYIHRSNKSQYHTHKFLWMFTGVCYYRIILSKLKFNIPFPLPPTFLWSDMVKKENGEEGKTSASIGGMVMGWWKQCDHVHTQSLSEKHPDYLWPVGSLKGLDSLTHFKTSPSLP